MQEAGASRVLPATSTPALAERNAELLKKHSEIWELMGLSPRAQQELNDTVVSINTGIHENQRPDAFEQATAKRSSESPLTYESYLAGHKRRFALLEISEPTQAELLAASDVFIPVLAAWETLIGLGLITGKYMRITLLLLFLQMPGTALPLVLLPDVVWTKFPYGLTMEGQYIIKNLVLIGAGLVLGGTVRDSEKISKKGEDPK